MSLGRLYSCCTIIIAFTQWNHSDASEAKKVVTLFVQSAISKVSAVRSLCVHCGGHPNGKHTRHDVTTSYHSGGWVGSKPFIFVCYFIKHVFVLYGLSALLFVLPI